MSAFLKRHAVPWNLILLFTLMALGIGGAAWWFYFNQSQQIRQTQQNELTAIAELKVIQIITWRTERFVDARLIMNDRTHAELLHAWRATAPPPAAAQAELSAWLETLVTFAPYRAAYLIDLDARLLLGAPNLTAETPALWQEYLAEMRAHPQPFLSDFHRHATTNAICLDLLVPLFDVDADSPTPTAILILQIDPYAYLYPQIQTWPTPSPTAETLLIHREQNQVVYLNELRHRADTALTLRMPISNTQLPAAQAALGQQGIIEGMDYRGVPVLAATRAVPDSPWFLIAKIDRAEIYAQLDERTSWFGAFIAGVLALAVTSVLIFWRQERVNFYRAQYAGERARRVLTQRYEYLMQNANDMIVLLDAHGAILEANTRALNGYGYTLAEIMRLNIRDLCAPHAVIPPETLAASATGAIFETTHRKKDGTLVPVEVSTRQIILDDQPLIQHIIRDITERKHTEAALRASEEKFRSLYESMLELVALHELITDADGNPIDYRILDCNPAFTRITGIPRAQAIGARASQVYHMPEPPYLATYAQVARTGVPTHFETYFAPMDKHFNISVFAPSPSHFATVALDISERVRAETQLNELNAALEHRVGERTAQLQAANKELEAFSYSVSHDLRAPLRALDGFSRIVLEEYATQLPPDAARYLGIIRANAQQMGRLIDDLLSFSRLSRQALNRQPVAMKKLAQDTLANLLGETDHARLTIALAELPPGEGDPNLLRQVWMNLIDNAIKYTRRRNPAHITIGFEPATDHNPVVYFVQDNGAGFDMQYSDKLFGVFQRLHRAEDYEGTGVGLAIVQRIIHRHGGRVWARAELEQGATFYFTLG